MTTIYEQLSLEYNAIKCHKAVYYIDISRINNKSIYAIRLLNGNTIQLTYEGISYSSALCRFIKDATILLQSIFKI